MASNNAAVLVCLVITVVAVSAAPGYFPISSQQQQQQRQQQLQRNHAMHARQRIQAGLDDDQLDRAARYIYLKDDFEMLQH